MTTTLQYPTPWKTESSEETQCRRGIEVSESRWIDIIDANGGHIFTIYDAAKPEQRAFAERICYVMNTYDKLISQMALFLRNNANMGEIAAEVLDDRVPNINAKDT